MVSCFFLLWKIIPAMRKQHNFYNSDNKAVKRFLHKIFVWKFLFFTLA